MARDNSPKERQRQQLERKASRRASYDRILVVSEGSKTEPNYFKEIRAEYRLHTANVEVQPSQLGTAPIQVVKYARQLFEEGDRHKRIPRRAFEQVYAVFDRDDHDPLFRAVASPALRGHQVTAAPRRSPPPAKGASAGVRKGSTWCFRADEDGDCTSD